MFFFNSFRFYCLSWNLKNFLHFSAFFNNSFVPFRCENCGEFSSFFSQFFQYFFCPFLFLDFVKKSLPFSPVSGIPSLSRSGEGLLAHWMVGSVEDFPFFWSLVSTPRGIEGRFGVNSLWFVSFHSISTLSSWFHSIHFLLNTFPAK